MIQVVYSLPLSLCAIADSAGKIHCGNGMIAKGVLLFLGKPEVIGREVVPNIFFYGSWQ